MFFNKILQYLNIFAWKKQSQGANTNLKLMHGINRISIFVFLFAIILMAVRFFIRK